MGMNYYLRQKRVSCPTCGQQVPDIHIGKSSAGWVFALHVHPNIGLTDWPEWKKFIENWPDRIIVDEYEREISLKDLEQIVAKRSHPRIAGNAITARFQKENGAIEGPKGLLRSKLDERCIGHGSGTWDLHIGDFS